MRRLLSAIFIVDELPHLTYVPWKEAATSALRFSDELIVVHGGKHNQDGKQPVLDYFTSQRDGRIKVLTFPWPDEFDWTQIARSCAYGQLHASGDWCFRVFIDEVFPDEFAKVRDILSTLPPHINIVSVQRCYLLGNQFACLYREKPLFFRRKSGLTFGMINPAQGKKARPTMFDDPVDTRRWFNGEEVIVNASILESPNAVERLLAGETPRGYRDMTHAGTHRLAMGFLNTGVSFMPNDVIIQQTRKSLSGYARLPKQYRKLIALRHDTILEMMSYKIKGMLDRKPLVKVNVPESLLEFADKHDNVVNVVRDLCEIEYGLPWNRVSKRRILRKRVSLRARMYASYKKVFKLLRLRARKLLIRGGQL